MTEKRLHHLRFECNSARYVRRVVLDPVLIGAAIAAFLLAISAWVAHRETRAYEIYTPTAYVVEPLLPWNASPPREWTSAVSVETGCNHISDKHGVKESIIYNVTFDDGTVAHVGDGIPINGSWLDAAERIDGQVRASGATFHPWTWLWRDSYHPLCVAALSAQSSDAAFERLKALLRLPEPSP
ncbi:hypothetical protein [Ancylobacter sp.]|uniref:hypothetical protein n=1 Tax=Ancylobacter sp. TaxID=1872567 RepID=UPI003BAB98E0